MFPLFIMFLISILAETNRAPFDLPEAESELVSGYNVEYSAIFFTLFFLAEYTHIIFMSILTSLLFFGGWLPPFDFFIFNLIPGEIWLALKTGFIIFVFVWVRATFPRFRYNTLMELMWKSYLPLSLGFLILTASILIAFNGLCPNF